MYADSMSNVCDPVYVHCILYLSMSCKNSLWCNLFCDILSSRLLCFHHLPRSITGAACGAEKKKTEDEASPRIFMALLFQMIS